MTMEGAPTSDRVRTAADPPRAPCARRAAAAWLLPPAAAVLILFAPALGRNRVHFFEDIPNGTYPMRVFLAESLRHGVLPLWCSDIYCGYPLLAEGQTGTFYPTNAIFFLTLPSPTAFELSLFVHYLLAAVGTFVFLGSLGLTPPARSVGAVAFAISGYMTARLAYINLIQVAAWLPWLLFVAGRVARTASRRWAAILAILMAAQLLAGHPQTCVYSFAAAAVWFVAEVRRGTRPLRAAALGGLALIVAVMVAAVQLVPTLELALHSYRQGGLTTREAGLGSMQPGWLATWVFPYFFGASEPDRYVLPGLPRFWGGTCFWELCAYPGIVALVLALVGAISGRRRLPFLVLGLLGLGLALGKYSPLFPLLQRLPVLGWFRLPARALLLTTFSLSVLAGMGLDAVLGSRPSRRVLVLALSAFVVASVTVFPLTRLVLTRSRGSIETALSSLLERRAAPEEGGEDLWADYHPSAQDILRQAEGSTRLSSPHNLYFLVLVAIVAVLVGLSGFRYIPWKSSSLLLLLLLGTDLCVFGIRYNPTLPARTAQTPPTVLKHLPKGDRGSWRMWAANDTHYFLSDYQRGRGDSRFADPWPEALELLPTNYNMLWHVPSPMGRTPLPLRSFHRLQEWLESNPHDTVDEVLDFCNVRYLLSYHRQDSLPQIAEGASWHLYTSPGAFPRVFVLPDSCESPVSASLETVLQGRLPLRSGILERQPQWRAEVRQYGRHNLEVVAALPGNGHLVVTDAWYPGWRATADGRPATVERAYGLFRSVNLAAGEHVVRFRYAPRSLHIGALLSLLGGVTVVAAAVPARRRRT
jgi:hypothetical protein